MTRRKKACSGNGAGLFLSFKRDDAPISSPSAKAKDRQQEKLALLLASETPFCAPRPDLAISLLGTDLWASPRHHSGIGLGHLSAYADGATGNPDRGARRWPSGDLDRGGKQGFWNPSLGQHQMEPFGAQDGRRPCRGGQLLSLEDYRGEK